MAVKFYDVRVDGEWAEFYVNERKPVKDSSGHLRYSASWCCLSSYGVFGHYWHSMGSPFKQFVADIEEDYLLSKIGQRVPSCDVIWESVLREIKAIRRSRSVTKEAARKAWTAANEILDDDGHFGSPDVFVKYLSEDEDLSNLKIEWTELNSMEWEGDALQFVRKLWPAFVAALNKGTV